MNMLYREKMKQKFLSFMKLWFHEQGDCCPIYDWNKFIVNEFLKEERDLVASFTQKLIEARYINLIQKSNGEYVAVTGYGAEKIKRNIIEVDL